VDKVHETLLKDLTSTKKTFNKMGKETAIDWLIDQLEKYELYSKISFQCLKEIDQAKEMEKEQIIHAYNQSWHFRDKPYETAEKYYNETFGGKDII
jgi:uncharacterized protein YxeA